MQEGNGIKRKPWEEGSCSTLLVGRLAFCNLPVPVLRRLPSLEPEMLSCNGFQSRAIRYCTYCNAMQCRTIRYCTYCNVEQSHNAPASSHRPAASKVWKQAPPQLWSNHQSAVHTCARHCLGLGDATIESNHFYCLCLIAPLHWEVCDSKHLITNSVLKYSRENVVKLIFMWWIPASVSWVEFLCKYVVGETRVRQGRFMFVHATHRWSTF